jgi:hypothetical protein
MHRHQAALLWASFPLAVRKRDACVSVDYRTTSAFIAVHEVDTVLSFRDVVFARANAGTSAPSALSDDTGMRSINRLLQYFAIGSVYSLVCGSRAMLSFAFLLTFSRGDLSSR